MLIISSQKIDTESPYSDEPFNSYHYPARYRNQIHEGDVFVYYQGNRSGWEHLIDDVYKEVLEQAENFKKYAK